MQETRQYILEFLRTAQQATVDEIVEALRKRRGDGITAVTVRHHLNLLQQDDLITPPELRHRSTPGRPQHVYTLTEKALDVFPNNYQHLAANLLNQIRVQLPPEGVNVILEGMVNTMVGEAEIQEAPLESRLVLAVQYLNEHGYNAFVETTNEGFILHTRNCPYHQLARTNDLLCDMDMRLVSALIGLVPRLMSRVSEGDLTCAYFIPNQA